MPFALWILNVSTAPMVPFVHQWPSSTAGPKQLTRLGRTQWKHVETHRGKHEDNWGGHERTHLEAFPVPAIMAMRTMTKNFFHLSRANTSTASISIFAPVFWSSFKTGTSLSQVQHWTLNRNRSCQSELGTWIKYLMVGPCKRVPDTESGLKSHAVAFRIISGRGVFLHALSSYLQLLNAVCFNRSIHHQGGVGAEHSSSGSASLDEALCLTHHPAKSGRPRDLQIFIFHFYLKNLLFFHLSFFWLFFTS